MENRVKARRNLLMLEVLVVVSVVAVGVGYIWKTRGSHNLATFSGTVTKVTNECAYDGTCAVIVDGKSIITGGGLTPDSKSNLYGRSDPVSIGDEVDVRAVKVGDNYTLGGCSACYIRRH